MRFSRDGAHWSDWEPYLESRGWQLADVDGPQPIFAQFRDRAGNVSAVATTAVTRDLITAPPASASYRIVRSVMGTGGGAKASASYALLGTSGQAFQTGVRQSASYRLSSGYWATAPGATNQPPNAPATPNPAHLATGVAVTTAVSWSGSDADNDPLTYEVRFGTANPPPQVVASQSATTYVAPTCGTTGVAVTTALSWTGSDPDNDPLTYEVRFGTTNPPPQVVASQSATTYDPPGNLAYSATYYWQVVASDGHGGVTPGSVCSFTTAAALPLPNVFFVSPSTIATIGGIPAKPADILRYEKAANRWTMVYDGSARGTLKNIGAFALLDDGSLLLVFSANQVIAGLGTATQRDIVQFTPNTPNVFPLGPGAYSFFLRGQWATVGLTTTGENIDALDVVPVPGGEYRVLISTTGAAAVPLPGGTVLKAADEDVLVYDKNVPPHWESALAIDGSLMPGMAVEDINGIRDDPQSGDYYVTILGAFNLGGVNGNGKTVIKLTPNASASRFTPSTVPWLATGALFPSNLDGLELVR